MTSVKRKIYINVAPCFTRIAIVEDNALAEVYIESKVRRKMLGNVCLGRVTNVLSGIQAAFVDIGLKRDAFLYVSDAVASEQLSPANSRLNLNTDDSLLNDTAEIELHISDQMRHRSIQDVVQPGQRILVQITREPMEMKGARVTTHITLPGRYLVLMASSEHVGISRRIEQEEERERLRCILEDIRPEGTGLIVRTAAEGASSDELLSDIGYLSKLWNKIQQNAQKMSPPKLVYHDLSAIPRVMRDLYDQSVELVLIDSEEEFMRCQEFVKEFAPDLIDRINFYSGASPLFTRYALEDDLKIAVARRVNLPSGGYLVFDDTEAMTVIDVNTGRFAGEKDVEETILKTNLEAAVSIASQVRLRDIGGIIVIDFIDMESQENRNRVLSQLRDSFEPDRSKINISGFTALGLVEITRKRIKRSLLRTYLQTCPVCDGRGMTMHPLTIAAQLIDELLLIRPPEAATGLEVRLHPGLKPYVDMCKESINEQFNTRGVYVLVSEDSAASPGYYKFNWL
jgi:ribonuclease G